MTSLLSNINKLLGNGIITSTLSQLNIAGVNISQIGNSSTQAVNQATSALNNTLKGIYDGIANLQKNASDQGVDTSDCTKTVSTDIATFTTDYMVGLADCPINIAAKGINMVNNDILYVYSISNLTISLPKTITDCQWKPGCLLPLVANYTAVIAGAPVKFTAMVTEVTTYTTTLQTQIAYCLASTSASTVAAATSWGLNITGCIGQEMINKTLSKIN